MRHGLASAERSGPSHGSHGFQPGRQGFCLLANTLMLLQLPLSPTPCVELQRSIRLAQMQRTS
jgi:hypothetical protein